MRPRLAVIVTLVVAVAAPAVWADPVTDPVKWSQLPRMDAYGYDFSSETTVPSRVADDFLCVDGQPVIDVHWWGSYYLPGPIWPYYTSDNLPDPSYPADVPPGILQGFRIEFWTDIPAGVDPIMPWSHPGQLLYEEFIPITQVQEALYGKVTHIGGVVENVWQYNTDLPIPFFQEAGNIYWLMIQAIHSDQMIQWGWHEADSLWHDNAVQMGYGRPGIWELMTDKDMAFELSIPEPVTTLLLGAGLMALIRKRR